MYSVFCRHIKRQGPERLTLGNKSDREALLRFSTFCINTLPTHLPLGTLVFRELCVLPQVLGGPIRVHGR